MPIDSPLVPCPRLFRTAVYLLVGAAAATCTGPRAVEAAAIRTYAEAPMIFERRDAAGTEYVARGQGYHVRVRPTETVVVLQAPRERRPGPARRIPAPEGPRARTTLHMSLLGGASDAGIEPEIPAGRVRHFVGGAPNAWRTDVPTYARLRVREVYPGIDVVYYGNQRRLEYDLVVAPGADPRGIRIGLAAADGSGSPAVRITAGGDLAVAAAGGDVRLHRPVAYQEIDGVRRPVSASWVVHRQAAAHAEVGFAVAAYDPAHPLVIDPVLEYAVHLGGAGGDAGLAVALDAEGNTYVAGYTDSADFPGAGGGSAGGLEAFVSKIAPDGATVVWTAFLGGSLDDVATGVAVDPAGHVYVAGYTDSPDFPTAGAYQGDGGSTDAFLVKIGPDGASLPYATYLAGAEVDMALGVAVDAAQNAYVTGYTASTDFPRLNSVHGDKPLSDAFVVRLDTTQTGKRSLIFSSYLGGAGDDAGQAVAVDAAGRVHVAGWTDSTNFPKLNYFMGDRQGRDGFLATLGPAGEFLYSTNIAGNGEDEALGVAVDGNGRVHVTGVTTSTNFPDKNAVQKYLKGGSDAFLTVVDPSAIGVDALLASTYLGGTGDDAGLGVAVDAEGRAILVGSTSSPDFPVVNALFGARGGTDAFVAKVDLVQSTPGRLVFSSHLGGTGDDEANAVAVDASGAAVVAGTTRSADFPATGAFGPEPGGADDAFVARLTHLDQSPPDLAVTALAAPGGVGAGGTVVVQETTRNLGESPASASTTRFYLSADPTLDQADLVLGARSVGGLDSQGADTASTTLSIPDTLPGGTYYLFARADADDAVTEGEEGNNATAIPVALGADLVVTSVAAPASGGAGSTMTVTAVIANAGSREAGASTARFYLSTDATLDPADTMLGSRVVPALAAGATSEASATVTIPPGTATAGYVVIAVADADGAVAEISESNNARVSAALAIGPDLAVGGFTAPLVAAPGAVISVTAVTVNQGGGPAGSTMTSFYLSADAVFDAGDVLLGSHSVPALAPGASHTGTTTLSIPTGTAFPVYLIARANASGSVVETSTANNTRASSALQSGGDLVAWVELPSGSRWAAAGASITVTVTTRNEGLVAAPASTTQIYLSNDTALDAGDLPIGSQAVPTLAPGALRTESVAATIPASIAGGQWYVLVKADGPEAVPETSETNNFVPPARDVLIGADLRVTLDVPGAAAVVAPGSVISVTDITRNASNVAAGPSTTRFYLSLDQTLDPGDLLVGSRSVPGLAPDSQSAQTTSITVPLDLSGSFHVIARADADGAVVEYDEANNTAVSVPIHVGTDLTAWVELPSGSGWAAPGDSIAVTVTTKNVGVIGAPASTTGVYLSADTVLDAGDVLVGARTVPALGPGATDIATINAVIPPTAAGGLQYLLASADAGGAVLETNEANNATPPARSVLIGADLRVALDVPGSAAVVAPGATITVADTTRNASYVTAGASTTRFYISADPVLDAGDIPVGSRPVPLLGPDTPHTGSTSLTIPADASGVFYVIARADADEAVTEHDEGNNTAISVPLRAGTDLTAWIELPSGSGWSAAGGSVETIVTTKNVGVLPAEASTTGVYLSADPVLDASDVLVGSRTVGPLPAGAIDAGPVTVTIPADVAGGLRYLLASADAAGAVLETNEENNATPPAREILIGADLRVTLDVPGSASSIAPGATITVADITRNAANVPAGPSTTRFYLSADQVLDAGDVPVGSREVPALAADSTNSGSTPITLPPDIGGILYLIAAADADGAVIEHTETNNTAVSIPVAVGPDLRVTLDVPGSAAVVSPGATVTVNDITRNAGFVEAGASITRFYLSADAVFDPGDLPVGSREVPALAADSANSGSTPITLPLDIGGAFHIIAVADADGRVVEHTETNNTAASLLVTVGTDLTAWVELPSGSGWTGDGGTIDVAVTTKNVGGVAAGDSMTGIYLSADEALDAGDVLLGAVPVPALPAGGSSTTTTQVALPSGLAGGTYYVLVQANHDGALPDANPANNFTPPARQVLVGADMVVVVDLSGDATLAAPGATITLADITRNASQSPAAASVTRFYLSYDGVWDATDVLLGERAIPELLPDSQSAGTTLVTLPAEVAGTFHILAVADAGGAVIEYDEANNVTVSSPFAVGADLAVIGANAAGAVAGGSTLYVSDTTKNLGGAAAPPSMTWFYLSTDGVLDESDLLLGTRPVPALASREYHSESTPLIVPGTIDPGTYQLIAVADGGQDVDEAVETNNAWVRPLDVLADLRVPTLSAPSKAYPGATITVTDTTRSYGARSPETTTIVVLSTDTSLDAGDLILGWRTVPPLAYGEESAEAMEVTLPASLAAGTYYLIAAADADGVAAESSETNNTRYKSLTIGPDLRVTSLSAPSSAAAGATIVVTDATTNLGSAAGATRTFYYLSANNTLDAGDVLLATRDVPALGLNEASTGSAAVTLPGTLTAGTWYLIAKADGDGAVSELNEGNNTRSRAISVSP